MIVHSYRALFLAIVGKEVTIAFRERSDIINPLIFFTLVITLFPLGVGPEPNLLMRMAPGVIWVAALLATLLSLDKLFREDYRDGSLEQLLLSPYPASLWVFAKILGHWLITGLPIVIMTPVFALLMNMDTQSMWAAVFSLLLGTPILSAIGAIGSALTVSLNKGGILLSLLVLPLYIPVLIFATSAIDASSMGMSYVGQLAILAAILVVALLLAPIAVSSALKVSVN